MYLYSGFYVIFLTVVFLDFALKSRYSALWAGMGRIVRSLTVAATVLPALIIYVLQAARCWLWETARLNWHPAGIAAEDRLRDRRPRAGWRTPGYWACRRWNGCSCMRGTALAPRETEVLEGF